MGSVESMTARPVFFFEGVDPAPSDSLRSDKGALVVGAATPRGQMKEDGEWSLSDNWSDWYFDYVYARVLSSREKASSRQWSGIIHEHHRAFGFEKILMDPGAGGGGIFIQRELRSPKQLIQGVETEVTPIADQVDGPRLVVRASFILHMFKRGDPGIELVWPGEGGKSQAGDDLLKDSFFASMKQAVDGTVVAWPGPVSDWYGERRAEVESWSEERRWALKNLDAATVQLGNITVATTDEGKELFTKRGARQFSSVGKDDIALASMLCFGAFLIWLRSDDWRQRAEPDDVVAFCGCAR